MTASPSHKDVERFEQCASRSEVSWMQRALFEPAHQATLIPAARRVPQPESILDVGCGTGKLLRRAKTVWSQTHLFGVDPAEGMIAMAERLTPNAPFLTGMAEDLPLPDSSVDLALSTISFHHWQDQAAGIREIARVLRPGGSFILVNFAFPAWLLRLVRLQRVHSPSSFEYCLYKQSCKSRYSNHSHGADGLPPLARNKAA